VPPAEAADHCKALKQLVAEHATNVEVSATKCQEFGPQKKQVSYSKFNYRENRHRQPQLL